LNIGIGLTTKQILRWKQATALRRPQISTNALPSAHEQTAARINGIKELSLDIFARNQTNTPTANVEPRTPNAKASPKACSRSIERHAATP
jgi:hypothetical protein